MTFLWRMAAVGVIAAAIAFVAVSRRRASHPGVSAAPVAASVALPLAVVLASLVLVGIVSRTVVRHLIQIAPLAVALLLLVRSRFGVAAAATLFAFWLLLMIAIWLFLFGGARIVSGTFTPAEITLTVVIGAASVAGLTAAATRGRTLPPLTRVIVVVAFAAFQSAAMIASALLLANR